MIETTLSLLREPDVTHVAVATEQSLIFLTTCFPVTKPRGVDPNLLVVPDARGGLGNPRRGCLGDRYEADDAIALPH